MSSPTAESQAPEAPRRRKERPAPLPDAFGYSVDDACRMTGFGRTKTYGLIREKKLKVTRVAGRTIIIGDSLRELLRSTAV